MKHIVKNTAVSLLAQQVTQGDYVPETVYLDISAYQGRKITSGGFELLLTDLITMICSITEVEYYKSECKNRLQSRLCYFVLLEEEVNLFSIGFLGFLRCRDEPSSLRMCPVKV